MSTTAEHTPPSPCDQLLDYVYDELSAAEAEAFKAHLPGCARCQAELASFQRVRGAVKAALPPVDPPVASTQGALHAQLLHAAAQRKPPAGKLLTFARKTRKVILSPGFAVAATFLIVGGVMTVQMKSGKMFMPAAEKTVAAPVQPAAPAVTAMPTTADVPAGAPVEEPAKAAEKAPEPTPTPAPKLTGKLKGKNEFDAVLGGVKGDVARDLSKHAAGKLGGDAAGNKAGYFADSEAAQPKADAPADKPKEVAKSETRRELAPPEGNLTAPAKKKLSLDEQRNEQIQKDRGVAADDSLAFNNGSVSRPRGGEGSGAGGAAATGSANARPGRSAPQTWNGQIDSTQNQDGWDKRNAYRSSTPSAAPQAAAPQAPPPPAATAPAPQAEMQQGVLDGKVSRMQQQGPAPATTRQAPMAKTPVQQGAMTQSAESLRKKAEELANAGRCEDAIRMYSEIERNYANVYTLAPKDKRLYENCLRLTGRKQEPPADELESLKRGKKQQERRTFEEERAAEQVRKPLPAPKPVAAPPPQAVKEKKRAPSKRADDAYAPAPAEQPAQTESKPGL